QELETQHGMRCNLLVAGAPDDLPGIDALEDADLAVLYLKLLNLPRGQLAQFRAYASSGKPIVALRSTTQGFNNWPEFGPETLGAGWHYDYGPKSGTEVALAAGAEGHPILADVTLPFKS